MAEQQTIPLTWRHASQRGSGTWVHGEYDILSGSCVVGRVCIPGEGSPPGRPYKWTLAEAFVVPTIDSFGFAASFRQAITALDKNWRKSIEERTREAMKPDVSAENLLEEYYVEEKRKSESDGGKAD